MGPEIIVMDSWAMIAYLEDELSAPQVENILVDSLQKGTQLLMTSVNLGEVWYNVARTYSIQTADQAIKDIKSLRVEIAPADWDLTYLAAQFKSSAKIAYTDCFAAALASIQGAELVTGDPEFHQFESKIKIHWV